jgi:RNA polymerase sigma factor (sigma-70 family)
MTTGSETFENLYKQYHPMVRQICLGYVKGDEEVAKDVTQEIFISIWNALPGFQGRSSYKTWIYRITVNTCLSHLRKNNKIVSIPLPDASNASVTESNSTDLLMQAIGQLAEVDRLVIMMVLDDLTYEEISEVMGVSEGNLRVRIHRIKKRLKTIMENGRL